MTMSYGWMDGCLFKNKNKPQGSPIRSPKEPPAINGSSEYKLNRMLQFHAKYKHEDIKHIYKALDF